MFNDALVSFIPPGTTLSMVAGAGVAIPSNVLDLLGLGEGVAPTNIIGQRTKFGMDPGIDWPRAQAAILVTTAFVTGNGATMNFQYQGAEEDPTTHLASTWNTIVESGPIAVTALNSVAGLSAWAWQFDFEPTHPLSFMPRFLRVLASPAAGTNFTAGAIAIPVTLGLDQPKQLFTPRNYAASKGS